MPSSKHIIWPSLLMIEYGKLGFSNFLKHDCTLFPTVLGIYALRFRFLLHTLHTNIDFKYYKFWQLLIPAYLSVTSNALYKQKLVAEWTTIVSALGFLFKVVIIALKQNKFFKKIADFHYVATLLNKIRKQNTKHKLPT